jgi:ABC-type amino acid transport substrate-binding protein
VTQRNSSLAVLFAVAYTLLPPAAVAAGTLRVLSYETRPFAYFEDGKPAGIEMEILDYFARSRGDELDVTFVDHWETLTDRLLAGEGDLVAATLTITPERQARMEFSIPYFPVRVMLVEPVAAPPATLGSLAGATLATIPGTTYEELLRQVPDAHFVYGTVESELFELLLAGRARAAAADSAVAMGLLPEFPGLRLGMPLTAEQHYGFAYRKDFPLAAELDQHIERLKASGIYYRILESHLGAEAVRIVKAAH